MMKKRLFLLPLIALAGYTNAGTYIPGPLSNANMLCMNGCSCETLYSWDHADLGYHRDEVKLKACIEKREEEKRAAYLNSPEYQQKLLAEKQAELEKKQAELEKRQKELEEKAQAEEKKKEEKKSTQQEAKPIEKKMDSTETQARIALGEKAMVVESLSKVIKEKDAETQARVKAVLEAFKSSKDEYTKNIGLYLSYLLK